MRELLTQMRPYKMVYDNGERRVGSAKVVYTGDYEGKSWRFGATLTSGQAGVDERGYRELFADWRKLDWKDKYTKVEGPQRDIFCEEVLYGDEKDDADTFAVLLESGVMKYFGYFCYIGLY